MGSWNFVINSNNYSWQPWLRPPWDSYAMTGIWSACSSPLTGIFFSWGTPHLPPLAPIESLNRPPENGVDDDFPCMGLQMDRWTGGPATVPVYIFTQRKIDGWWPMNSSKQLLYIIVEVCRKSEGPCGILVPMIFCSFVGFCFWISDTPCFLYTLVYLSVDRHTTEFCEIWLLFFMTYSDTQKYIG